MEKKVFDLDKCETNEQGELVCPEMDMPKVDDSLDEQVKDLPSEKGVNFPKKSRSPGDNADIV
jgi:hypothetical protein